ncbi:hypothetical protein D3C75_1138650 [compost metagenome]
MGLPTMLLRPTTTACLPAISTFIRFSTSMTPAGVQGRKPGLPIIRLPTLIGWKQSTSLSG